MKYYYLVIVLLISIGFTERRVPAEWEAQEAVWIQWPNTWFEQYMKPEVAEVIAKISHYEKVNVIIPNLLIQNSIYNLMNTFQPILSNINFHILPYNNAWIRDNGPTYIEEDGYMKIVHIDFDGWGGLDEYQYDNLIPYEIAAILSMEIEDLNYINERGNLEFNGNGVLLTNWDCWQSRNPNAIQSELENDLIEIFGLNQVIWTYGHLEWDFTTGHIDYVARFVNDSTVAVKNYLNIDDPDAWVSDSAVVSIEAAGLNVILIDMPGYISFYNENIPAVYMNYILVNGALIGNAYGVEEWDNNAREQLGQIYPDREIILIETFEVQLLGGGIHCFTNDQPLSILSTTIAGDINEDGIINVIDVLQVIQFILSEDFNSNADMNNDNQLNVIDVVQLVNIILGN